MVAEAWKRSVASSPATPMVVRCITATEYAMIAAHHTT